MARRSAEERRRAAAAFASSRNSSGSSGYNAATSAGRSTTSAGLGSVNNDPHSYYWGSDYVTPLGQGTTQGYQGFRQGIRDAAGTGLGTSPGYSGGGGGGWGGGGGGGGGGLTQAMLDSMLKALGTAGRPLDLPDFQGANLPAFNPAVYRQASQQLQGAVAADQAAINRTSQQTGAALGQNYSNAYANAPVTAAPQATQVGTALQGTAGGGGNAAGIAADTGAAGASDQASFQNLLSVLAAADQTAQNSRMNEVELNRGSALQGVGAQNRALSGQIGMAKTQAQQQWAQQDAERRYQNSLMTQQWNREEAQGNWQQNNEMIANRLGPLLDLIGQGRGLNTAGVQALLNQWSSR